MMTFSIKKRIILRLPIDGVAALFLVKTQISNVINKKGIKGKKIPLIGGIHITCAELFSKMTVMFNLCLLKLVMGPGQFFVAQAGSAIFGLGLEKFP